MIAWHETNRSYYRMHTGPIFSRFVYFRPSLPFQYLPIPSLIIISNKMKCTLEGSRCALFAQHVICDQERRRWPGEIRDPTAVSSPGVVHAAACMRVCGISVCARHVSKGRATIGDPTCDKAVFPFLQGLKWKRPSVVYIFSRRVDLF